MKTKSWILTFATMLVLSVLMVSCVCAPPQYAYGPRYHPHHHRANYGYYGGYGY